MARVAEAAFSERRDGDFSDAVAPTVLAARRQELLPGDWHWMRQVHGGRVVVVDGRRPARGAEADALVTAAADQVLSVRTADCAPVVFVDDAGAAAGIAHAGWRSIEAGILESTVAALTQLGATGIRATVGPHIRARCYEFGRDDRARLVARYGHTVEAETGWGTPGLDLLAAVIAALDPLGVPVEDRGGCTACEPTRFPSHRARGERDRLVSAVVLRPGRAA